MNHALRDDATSLIVLRWKDDAKDGHLPLTEKLDEIRISENNDLAHHAKEGSMTIHPDLQRMTQFMSNFEGNPERLAKYTELMMLHEDASPIAYQSRESIGEVNVVLTTKCNLRCVWCHREEDHYQHYLNRENDYDKVVKLLPELKGFHTLHWAGLAEPLLYPRLFELNKLARQYFPRVKITTNGTLLKPSTCDKLIESGLNFLEVSIDGFDGVTNKKYRGNHEERVIDYLKYLSDNSDIPIQINTVLADVNYESLFDAIDRLKDVKNIVLMHTIPLFMTKHMLELGIKEITTEQHRLLLEHWRKKIDEYGLKIKLSPDTVEAKIDPVITLKRKHNLCFTVYEAPYVNVDGYITPCGRLQHTRLDNVFEMGFEKAWNGPKSVAFRANHLKGNYGAHCQRECHMKNTCHTATPAPEEVLSV